MLRSSRQFCIREIRISRGLKTWKQFAAAPFWQGDLWRFGKWSDAFGVLALYNHWSRFELHLQDILHASEF